MRSLNLFNNARIPCNPSANFIMKTAYVPTEAYVEMRCGIRSFSEVPRNLRPSTVLFPWRAVTLWW